MTSLPEGPERLGNSEGCLELALDDLMRIWEVRVNSFTRPEDLEATLESAVEEINSINPHIGKRMLFSGEGIVPVLEKQEDEESGDTVISHKDGIPNEGWGQITHAVGIYQGVWGISTEEGGTTTTRFLHEFHIGSQPSRPALTCKRTDELHCYVTADATMMPIDEIEAAYNPGTDLDDGAAQVILGHSSQELSKFMCSTLFRRMKHDKQLRVVNTMIEGTEIAAGVRDKWALVEATYCYAPLFKDGKVYQIPLDISDVVLSGPCLGVDTLERIQLAQRAIRSDKHMLDKEAGLCLVIEPEPSVATALRINEGQILFVPISSQEVAAIFAISATQ